MTGERLVSLDLLRGVAAFSVAIPHFLVTRGIGGHYSEAAAVIAVEVFFVLSGYVLAPQILHVLSRPHELPIFLARRWMRTIPAFIVALVLVAVATRQLWSADFWRTAFYVQNFMSQHNSVDFYPVAWSLAVEEWFYVLFPPFMLTCALFFKPSTRGYALAALGFIAIVSILRIELGNSEFWGSSVRRVVAFRIDAIAWGFLLYLANFRPRLWHLPTLALIGLAITITLQSIPAMWAQIGYPFLSAAFGALAILVFLGLEERCRRPKMLKFATWIGWASYSIYLFHLITIQIVVVLLQGWPPSAQIAAFIALTAIAASVTAYYIEAPFLRLRPQYGVALRAAT